MTNRERIKIAKSLVREHGIAMDDAMQLAGHEYDWFIAGYMAFHNRTLSQAMTGRMWRIWYAEDRSYFEDAWAVTAWEAWSQEAGDLGLGFNQVVLEAL